jgi:hypothetical protein
LRFPGVWEVVRARGLHQLAPELGAVMLVDENGHGKGLPLNRRAGELYGADAIAGDALSCQERLDLVANELRGFSQKASAPASPVKPLRGSLRKLAPFG